MAYRFDGVDDQVRFGIGPLNGYTFGPVTIAYYVNKIAGTSRYLGGVTASGGFPVRITNDIGATSRPSLAVSTVGTAIAPTAQTLDIGTWTIVVATWAGPGTTPQFHMWEGSWLHGAGTTSIASDAPACTGSDEIRVSGTNSLYLNADYVCVGIKKSDSTNTQVETLSATDFRDWLNFGFDWLVGFEDSATVTNRMSGGGDETSRVGTTLVSDPPGFLWADVIPDPATTDWVPLWQLP